MSYVHLVFIYGQISSNAQQEVQTRFVHLCMGVMEAGNKYVMQCSLDMPPSIRGG